MPIFINAALEGSLSFGNLRRVRWCVIIVICVGGDTVQVGRVCRLTLIGEEAEVLEDVVLCMSSDPRSVKM